MDSLLGQPVVAQLLVDVVDPDLVELVDGHRDVHDLVSLADDLSDTGKDLPVVDHDRHADAELGEHGVDDLHQLDLIEQRVAAYDIGIALIELTVAAFLGAVSAPYGLNLIALERKLELLTVHDDIACERHGQIITRIEDFEKELVALITVFAKQRVKGLHRGSLNLQESIKGVNTLYGIEDIVSFGHLLRTEITGALGDGRFV